MFSASGSSGRWIQSFQPGTPDGVRLICFPHAGGSASYYFRMSRTLAPGVEVLAVQYPGRQDRHNEPKIDSIAELAERILPAVKACGDRPYAFFGHSMGAVIAFEVATRLQEHGAMAPIHLFASGRRAPSTPHHGTVHQADDAGIIAELRRIGGTDERFLDDPDLVRTIVEVTRNDYHAVETYRWRESAPLACPVTVLVGDSDPQVSLAEAAAWELHTTGGFDLRVHPGGHFYLDSCHDDVAKAITDVLSSDSTVFDGTSS